MIGISGKWNDGDNFKQTLKFFVIPIFKLGAYEQILTLKALDSFMIMEPYDLNNEQKLSLVALETIPPTQASTGVFMGSSPCRQILQGK